MCIDLLFCCLFRNHDWFRKDLPIYLFPSSKLESDVIDQECLTQVCEVSCNETHFCSRSVLLCAN